MFPAKRCSQEAAGLQALCPTCGIRRSACGQSVRNHRAADAGGRSLFVLAFLWSFSEQTEALHQTSEENE